jgi:hypothetical protein
MMDKYIYSILEVLCDLGWKESSFWKNSYDPNNGLDILKQGRQTGYYGDKFTDILEQLWYNNYIQTPKHDSDEINETIKNIHTLGDLAKLIEKLDIENKKQFQEWLDLP